MRYDTELVIPGDIAEKTEQHRLAGKPIPFDYWIIVREIFEEKATGLKANFKTDKRAPLKQAFAKLREKGLTDPQIDKVRECLRSAVHAHENKYLPRGIKSTSFDDNAHLGMLFDGKAINAAFAKDVLYTFTDNLSIAMKWSDRPIEHVFGADHFKGAYPDWRDNLPDPAIS